MLGAVWKTMEAKFVKGTAIANGMPGYKTCYDMQPLAGQPGFDDSLWPVMIRCGIALDE